MKLSEELERIDDDGKESNTGKLRVCVCGDEFRESMMRRQLGHLWSNSSKLHKISSSLEQWLVSETQEPGRATQGD